MAIANVQVGGVQSSGVVASAGVTLGSDVTAGNLIVVPMVIYNSNTFTVTDNQGNYYILDTSVSSGNEDLFIFRTTASATGSLTVTVTNTGGDTYISFGVAEFSGVERTGIVLGCSTATGSAANPNAGSITSRIAGALYVGCTSHSGSNPSPDLDTGAGFTTIFLETNTSNEPIGAEFKIQSAAGAMGVGWTSGNSDWAAAACAYSPITIPAYGARMK